MKANKSKRRRQFNVCGLFGGVGDVACSATGQSLHGWSLALALHASIL